MQQNDVHYITLPSNQIKLTLFGGIQKGASLFYDFFPKHGAAIRIRLIVLSKVL